MTANHFLLVSDIHTEFMDDDGQHFFKVLASCNEQDCVIIAGDLSGSPGETDESLRVAADCFSRVVFVPGNHDFWGGGIGASLDMWRETAEEKENVDLLYNGTCMVKGQRLIGTTLWFPDTPLARQWAPQFPDCRLVSGGALALFQENRLARLYLTEEMRSSDVVITHHLPSYSCVDPKYQGQDSNCFFVGFNDGRPSCAPSRWVFGHTHESADFVDIRGTRFVCNPFGYQDVEVNKNFKWDCVI